MASPNGTTTGSTRNPSQLTLAFHQVVKSNDLVKAHYDWSVLMHRIIMTMIAKIGMKDDEFELQRITVRELEQLTGINDKDLYTRAADAADQLLEQRIRIRGEDGNYHGYNLLSDTHYIKGRGVIMARFNEQMKPFLLQLKRRFTQYALHYTMQLESVYSIRLYEYCKMMDGMTDVFELTVEELRDMLCLGDKYARFSDLKRRVIVQAQEELAEKCDLTFDYRITRDGRTPQSVKFFIKKKERAPEAPTVPHIAEGDRDPFEEWFEALPEDERQAVQTEAMERARRALPGVKGIVLQAEAESIMRRIWKERT